MKERRKSLLFLILTCTAISLTAQTGKLTREEYIKKYQYLAIKEMGRTGIPASITMAQGLLESGNGNSRLAVKANNHFGIKCHDWSGKKVRHDDDASRECFRKYSSVEESYRDHSDFLTSKSRYAALFDIPSTDYKGWAKGLKKAGYATSPTYAEALIRIVEENRLYLLDQGVDIPDKKDVIAKKSERSKEEGLKGSSREILENNRVKYIVARTSDTYQGITQELEMLPWQLAKYNELEQDFEIKEGQVVYIQPKRTNANAVKTVHIVAEGETMYSISQKYAIRLDRLYARNIITPGTEPTPGTVLSLRGKIKNKNLKATSGIELKDAEQEEMQFEFDPE
ncbi:MAG: glucosaminidase domain-containing protein [Bacteroidales bacterium]